MPESRPITRRRLLRQSSAVVASAAVAASLSSRAYAQGSEEIKVALVGCGGRGTGAAAQALSAPGPVKLHAVADVYEDRMEDSLTRLKGRGAINNQGSGDYTRKIDVPSDRRFIGFDAYKHAIDSGPDVVILATPPGFRPMMFEYAVNAGRHVFMEKPVAVDAPGIRRILAANEIARQKGLKVGVGLQRHHQGKYIQTLDRIRDGAIGDISYLRCYWNSAGAQWRSRELGATEMQYQVRNWYYFTWLSGDHIVEQHIHNIDVCNWVMNDHPISAQGMGGRQVRTGNQYGYIYDHHAVEFVYPSGVKMYSYCRHIKNTWSQVSEHAHGTKGYADLSDARIHRDQMGRDTIWRHREKDPNPYQQEHDDLQHAIRNNESFNEAEYGAHSTMTAIMGRMCTYSGKMLTWDEAINSKVDLMPEKLAWDADPPVLPGEDGSYPIAVPGVTQVL